MKNRIRKSFTQVPNDLINDNQLSRDARFLFVYLCSKPDDWKYFVKTIENELACSKDARIKYMNELKVAGWITVEQKVDSKGKFGANEVVLNPWPKKPATVPQAEISAADKNRGGKNQPLNNKELKQISNLEQKNTGPQPNLVSAPSQRQQPEQDLFGEAPNPNKKTLFENSAYFNLKIFKEKLKEAGALGVDLEYYHRAVNNWSTSKNQKRTGKGWIATARTWMERDKDAKKLKMIKSEQEEVQESAEMLEYFKM